MFGVSIQVHHHSVKQWFNGSAYGNGIYTAIKGNHWLSQSYTDNNELFVCGVADPHRSGENVESEKKTSTTRSPSVLMSLRLLLLQTMVLVLV